MRPPPIPSSTPASTSPYRRALVARLGIPFRCLAPRFDETIGRPRGRSARRPGPSPGRGKAGEHRDAQPDATIIGCDQLVSFDGRIFGKPGGARPRRRSARGHVGQYARADHGRWCVLREDRLGPHRRDRMTMRPLDRARARTVRRPPIGRSICAGATSSRSAAIVLFERIESADHHRDHRAAAARPDEDSAGARASSPPEDRVGGGRAPVRHRRSPRRGLTPSTCRSPGRAFPSRTACGYSRGRRASRHRRGAGSPRCR